MGLSGMVWPSEFKPLVAMSAPRPIRTESWNRLSGVRFSWKMTTICCKTAAVVRLKAWGPLLGGLPLASFAAIVMV